MRRWLEDDEQELALCGHMVGAHILSDLKQDLGLKGSLDRVSERVSQQRSPLSAQQDW